jgi:hypothetical protein
MWKALKEGELLKKKSPRYLHRAEGQTSTHGVHIMVGKETRRGIVFTTHRGLRYI